MPGPINRHDKLRDGELPRRYWRLRDEDLSDRDELGLDPDLEVDEYWDPDLPASALDFRLQRAWEEVLSVAFAPSLADFVSESMRETWTASATTPSSPQIAAADLATALRTHLETVIGDEHPHDYLAKLQQAGRLDDIRAAVVRTPVLGRWFAHQRGPAVMALVVAPFWIRSLVEWSPPDDTTDLVAVTVSLVDHLLVRYPLPKPLYRAWMGSTLPTLKWACWTVLLGQGASLHRAAAQFGWQVSARFPQCLLEAPWQLDILEAVTWAEVSRLGGSAVEHARLWAHRAYRIDPTASYETRDGEDGIASDTTPGFWRATVLWLARHRAALDDDACRLILDWAMHRHTEDVAHERPEAACFSWRGREPAPALEEATRYNEAIVARFFGGHFARRPISWRRRNWDWEHERDGVVWSIRELCNDRELDDEGQAMHHCVGGYAYSCAQGQAAIFSVTANGARRVTVQLDPRTRQIVQVRGERNRPCDPQELEQLHRWLSSLATTSL